MVVDKPQSTRVEEPTLLFNQVTLDNSGDVTGSSTTAGPGYLSPDQPISGTYSWASAEYGTVLVTNTTGNASCVVVSSTEFVCIDNTASKPNVAIFNK